MDDMDEHENGWEWAMRVAYRVASATGHRMRVYSTGTTWDACPRHHYNVGTATASA